MWDHIKGRFGHEACRGVSDGEAGDSARGQESRTAFAGDEVLNEEGLDLEENRWECKTDESRAIRRRSGFVAVEAARVGEESESKVSERCVGEIS